ncbi:MAG: tripartite tricarboxylate transporter TctB family protein [Alphaproteobacteria bacterium]
MSHILLRQNVLGGLLLVLFGILGLALGSALEPGTLRRMGPGFFPRVLSWLLVGIGAGVAMSGARDPAAERVAPGEWRPLAMVTIALLCFQLFIDRLGLVAATVAVVGIAALGGRETRWPEVAALAALLAVGSALLFVVALDLPIPLWGR